VQVSAVSSVQDQSTVVYRHSNAAAEPAPIIFDSFPDGTVPSTLFERGMKRAFDIVLATIGLILFSPIVLLSSLAIKIESRGPVFDRQRRHSYNNDSFGVFRFRCTTTLNITGVVRATRKRVCVTRIGRILHSSGIDGLPQLINVLRGEMSIVGPRAYEMLPGAIVEEEIMRILQRRDIKPGLIGWAQVNGYWDKSNSFGAMRRRIECDVFYVENWSFILDMKIILMTLCSKKPYGITEQPGERRFN
jgi:lipopolysaccharide/colanic/teichoic acid biosynthesis glycosyltransferase